MPLSCMLLPADGITLWRCPTMPTHRAQGIRLQCVHTWWSQHAERVDQGVVHVNTSWHGFVPKQGKCTVTCLKHLVALVWGRWCMGERGGCQARKHAATMADAGPRQSDSQCIALSVAAERFGRQEHGHLNTAVANGPVKRGQPWSALAPSLFSLIPTFHRRTATISNSPDLTCCFCSLREPSSGHEELLIVWLVSL